MEKWADEYGSWRPLTVEVFFAGMTGRPITSSSHVFTNPESTKPDFFFHEICCLQNVHNGFSFKNQNRL